MLLIIEALLLILSALAQDHRAAVERKIYPLDMALNSVDDQYKGCRENMRKQVERNYLKKETSDQESDLANAWKDAVKKHKTPGDNLTRNHSIAIYVYTNSDAIQILKKTQKKCYSTYRGTNIKFNKTVLNKEVRFGSFTSSSLSRNRTRFFGNVSCFEIRTCEGADLTKYSKHPEEKEVLIPPFEKFKVTAHLFFTGSSEGFDRMKMLLIIEAFLLILSALGQDHRAAVEGRKLDTAPNSVDDYYYDCRENMAKDVKKYLNEECGKNPEFKKAWEEGEKNVLKHDTLKLDNSVAIYVYTDTEFKIYKIFNNDARNGKQNYKDGTYKWYSLQFLLKEAIEILRKKQNRCFKTFRGTNLKFNEIAFPSIRFGSITSSSLDRNIAKRFGSKSCFEIYTCLGADVTEYSRLPYEKEVLISPYEMFKVTAVRTKQYQKDLWCDTVFTLKSSGTRKELNCALCKKEQNKVWCSLNKVL
ncbi:NAD(P)(+)--arginine ADP-ribosyltransferase 2 [Anabarilius grahami]|uniref:NAD(P)(+)--arginine ADP-ribosyltransferase n=1 Tax=Anabarilius grahami TaxID=495550 RepID=A0A3N0Y0C7_ANAGA|nr:NAD(P)(+)--arginine ADP-ribosyltransferase 2 [Anabarilius grahami]